MDIRELDLTQLPRNQKQHTRLTVASRADGGDWRLPLLLITGAAPGPTLVVTAAVHGDEYEGVEVIAQLFRTVQPDELCGALVMLPVCNVPAYEAALRSSPIDGLNLARVFPGDVSGTITQRIAYWMTEKLLKHADFYIDLHSGGIAGNIPTLIGYSHDAGSLGQASLAGARVFGAPVLWGHPLPVAPGRTVSAATDLGVPWLYTEAPGGGYARPDDVVCFRQGVMNVMRHLGMLAGDPEPRPMTHHLYGDGDLDSVISAQTAGYFRAAVELLSPVLAGQRLGVVQNFAGEVMQEVVSDRDGVVIMLRRLHRVHVGDGLAHITGVVSEE